MKTIWSGLLLTVAAAFEMLAQFAPNVTTNAIGLGTSLSESNAIHQSIVERMAKNTPSVDPASRTQETNRSGQAVIPASAVAVAAGQQTAMPEEVELLSDGAIARFGPTR